MNEIITLKMFPMTRCLCLCLFLSLVGVVSGLRMISLEITQNFKRRQILFLKYFMIKKKFPLKKKNLKKKTVQFEVLSCQRLLENVLLVTESADCAASQQNSLKVKVISKELPVKLQHI